MGDIEAEVMKLQDGDVLVLRAREHLTPQVLKRICMTLEKSGRRHILVIDASGFSDISVFNEKKMAEHGWVRKDATDAP